MREKWRTLNECVNVPGLLLCLAIIGVFMWARGVTLEDLLFGLIVGGL